VLVACIKVSCCSSYSPHQVLMVALYPCSPPSMPTQCKHNVPYSGRLLVHASSSVMPRGRQGLAGIQGPVLEAGSHTICWFAALLQRGLVTC
jgi:hypothetical protein